mmetsp:Transcript_16710/g.33398  ORF Transcript_16710/g.33398 Transcript_16710/m.33398 type:complete len:88 (-) Transcript_16710:1109-1372(-)
MFRSLSILTRSFGCSLPFVSSQKIHTEEPFYETEYEKNKFTHDFCAELSDHLVHFKNLPVQCNKYTDVVDKMKKKDKDTTPGTADLS